MKTLQLVIWKLMCVGLVVGGVALVRFPSSDLYHLMASHVPANAALRIGVAAVVVLAGVIGLAPLERMLRRKRRAISFPGAAGTVTIELGCIEADLSSTVSKLPQVQDASIRVLPSENGQKVRVVAEVALRKGAGTSARDVGHQVREAIAQAAKRILGGEEVATVDLNIRRLSVDAGAAPAVSRVATGQRPPSPHPLSEAPALDKADAAAAESEETEPLIPGAVSPSAAAPDDFNEGAEPAPWGQKSPGPTIPGESEAADSTDEEPHAR